MQIGSHDLGITYEEFNVILFVIIHPLITLLLLIWYIRHTIKRGLYKRANNYLIPKPDEPEPKRESDIFPF